MAIQWAFSQLDDIWTEHYFQWQVNTSKSGAALTSICSRWFFAAPWLNHKIMKTSLNYTSGMQIVNNLAELKGVNQVYGGATFQDGDIVEIPENPQMQKFVRPNGKTRIEIGVLINGAAKWVNLAAFTKLPVEGEGAGFKAAFQKAHPVNDQIAQGDACSQILVLCELKKLKVHKEKNWDVILVQNENGKWGRKKNEKGEDEFRQSSFSVFEVVTE